VGADVLIDSEPLLVTDFMNLKIKPAQSFRGAHRGRVCVRVFIRICQSGFTTLLPVPLQEQYRCGSFDGGAQIALGVGYQGIRWTRRFTWFGPPERNTLRPRVKGVVLLCLSARVRSSLFSPLVRASV
jgi:hypothetical protein